jgi:hypothetical protein
MKLRGRPKGSRNKTRPVLDKVHASCTKPELVQEIGRFVRYWDRGWRFATLIGIENNQAHLTHPVTGPHWVNLKEVEPWVS